MTQRNYKATGINLKAMPMGESDRLVTILTKEAGLIRAIAPGARKHKSKLAGRTGLFVVNDLFFAKGRSLDKLVQAETQRSFPGLSKDLAKLTASQYLAEIALAIALTEQPQDELYYLLIEHLGRLEAASKPNILPCLAQATFHLLALAGVAPEVFRCCLSRSLLTFELGQPDWRVAFSVSSGGAIDAAEVERLERDRLDQIEQREKIRRAIAQEQSALYLASQPKNQPTSQPPNSATNRRWMGGFKDKVAKEVRNDLGIIGYLSAAELALMQQLSKPELVMTSAIALGGSTGEQSTRHISPESGTIRNSAADYDPAASGPHLMWRHIEKFLRQYAQYQFDRPIRSAALIDTCFTSPTHAARV
ncbi:MAG: DNA repair protein RecO [Phormidesmis sp.]